MGERNERPVHAMYLCMYVHMYLGIYVDITYSYIKYICKYILCTLILTLDRYHLKAAQEVRRIFRYDTTTRCDDTK